MYARPRIDRAIADVPIDQIDAEDVEVDDIVVENPEIGQVVVEDVGQENDEEGGVPNERTTLVNCICGAIFETTVAPIKFSNHSLTCNVFSRWNNHFEKLDMNDEL